MLSHRVHRRDPSTQAAPIRIAIATIAAIITAGEREPKKTFVILIKANDGDASLMRGGEGRLPHRVSSQGSQERREKYNRINAHNRDVVKRMDSRNSRPMPGH
jgi:hypothetical protein